MPKPDPKVVERYFPDDGSVEEEREEVEDRVVRHWMDGMIYPGLFSGPNPVVELTIKRVENGFTLSAKNEYGLKKRHIAADVEALVAHVRQLFTELPAPSGDEETTEKTK